PDALPTSLHHHPPGAGARARRSRRAAARPRRQASRPALAHRGGAYGGARHPRPPPATARAGPRRLVPGGPARLRPPGEALPRVHRPVDRRGARRREVAARGGATDPDSLSTVRVAVRRTPSDPARLSVGPGRL